MALGRNKGSTGPFQRTHEFLSTDEANGAPARALLQWIINDKIDVPESIVSEVQEAYEDDAEFGYVTWLGVFRALGGLGVGKLIVGRHGHPTRFAWLHKSSLVVADSVVNFPKVRRTAPPEPSSNVSRVVGGKGPSSIKVGRIEVRFPPLVTQAEVNELVKFLDGLARSKPA